MPRVEAEVGSAASSYEILAKLATGGMAEIFLARGANTAGVERYVVLKRILRHRASDAAFVRMFLDEAKLAALLQHPNIAQVYDIGKLGDSYFFTMEYVHGETVRAVLQRSHGLRTPIPFQSVLVIAAGAAAGLHHAHERNGYDGKPLGIVHRDVSPSNLMVSYEGTVKVVDFGVAKAAHRSQETRSGAVKGKISYLSPEQCRGGAVDRRSDLFSLGIVMWEMLTTERLYKRGTDFEAMAAIVSEEVPPPSARRPDVPRELDGIVLRLLAKDPAQRYQTAADLQEELENVAVRLGSALSTTALARFLREMFGQRPEPWVEMQSREHHPEAFTVTSEPIPPDLVIPVAEDMDLKLGGVPDLSEQRPRPPTDGPATQPFRLSESESSGSERPPLPAGLMTLTAQTANIRVPDGPTTLPYTRQQPVQDVAAVAQPAPTAIANAPSASYPSIASYPALASRDDEPPARARKVPAFVIFVVAAVAIGIVLGIVFALSGGRTDELANRPGSDVVATSTGSAVGSDTHVGSADDTHATIGSSDAAAGSGSNDAHAMAGSNDAHAAAGSNDAHAGSNDAHATDDVRHASDAGRKVEPHKSTPAEELAKHYAASRYTDAVATCTANPPLASTNPSACAISACRVHDATRARKWLAGAGARKAMILAACKAAGTSLEPPAATTRPRDDCAADPMACQH